MLGPKKEGWRDKVKERSFFKGDQSVFFGQEKGEGVGDLQGRTWLCYSHSSDSSSSKQYLKSESWQCFRRGPVSK